MAASSRTRRPFLAQETPAGSATLEISAAIFTGSDPSLHSDASTGLSWEAADPRGISRGDMEFLLAVIEDIATIALIVDSTLRLTFRISPDHLAAGNSRISFFGETNTDLGATWSRVDPVDLGEGAYAIEVAVGNEPIRFLRLGAEEIEVE